jgi:hypothetical protein
VVTKNLGRVASAEAVALYALLARADHPLTFAEVCDGMPPAFRNDATRQYREWARKKQPDLDAALNAISGELPDEVRQRAWQWWVRQQLANGLHYGSVLMKTKPGVTRSIRHATVEEKVWTANPDKPPTVRVPVYSESFVPVKWTPDGAGAEAPRLVRKARYLNANDEMMAIVEGLRSKEKDRLLEHLRNGAFALDDQPEPQE